ncbi:MAG: SCO family protein [Opitutales bacterium]
MKPTFLGLYLAGAIVAWSADRAGPAQPSACPCCQQESTAGTGTDFSKTSIYQLDDRFTDDSGRPFSLGSLRGRPVVIDLFFASCGYACPLAVTDMVALQNRLPAALRTRAAFVLVSFDPTRDTPAALARYRAQRHLDANWTLLHADAGSVRELAALLGVKYQQAADGSFVHSNLLTVLNPAGEIVHQRVGLQGGLDELAAALARHAP